MAARLHNINRQGDGKRHEQELAEIKGLIYELDQRTQEILERLERLDERAQGQLAWQDQLASQEAPNPGRGSKKARRKRGAGKARREKVRQPAPVLSPESDD